MPDGSMVGGDVRRRAVQCTSSPRTTRSGASIGARGKQSAAANFADLVGAADEPAGFTPAHEVIASQWRTYGAVLRTPRSLLTWQTALAAILEQRVTGSKRAVLGGLW